MKTKALIAALLLVGSVLPSAGARHLSAGFEDTVGVGADETPEDPTVTPEDRQRGLETDGCWESEGNISADAAMRATEADGFCGELVYHEGTNFSVESPPDQEIRVPDRISQFDVHVANYAGTAIERWNQPFVDPAWDALHQVGEQQGLTESAEKADSEDGDRTQAYHVAVHYPFATHVLQENTGAWEMNGPYSMEPMQAFVGFIYDDEGQPVSDDDLASMIEQEGVSDDAIPAICGFQPFGSFAAINNIGSCGIELTYVGPEDDGTNFDGYDDECESPAYVCNPTAGGAWHGRIQCQTQCGSESETSYEIWHWVAAPVLEQECSGQAPGFALDPKAGETLPYLAHDLDVYTPTASAVEEVSFPTTWTWANDAADNALDPVNDAIDSLPEIPALPEIPDVSETTTLVQKDARVEPNAEPAGDLADTSQSLHGAEELARTITDCEALTSSEDPETVDPWVDIVDGQAHLGVTGQRSGSGLENLAGLDLAALGSEGNGLYGTPADHQDSSNRPGPATVWTEGKVGMFTDKDDDGSYGQEGLGSKYQLDQIEDTGAYPLLWDMWVDSDDAPDTGQGCTVVGGDTHTALMIDAGYGPDTGLAQLVYLNEPTAFIDPATGEAVTYTEGNNIYVLASQSVKQLWTSDDLGDGVNELDRAIDDRVEALQAYAQANNGGAGEPAVHLPGSELNLASDFQGQCDEPTGGFTSALTFVHDCTLDCSGDTIATVYTFEATDGTLGGGDDLGTIPEFTDTDGTAYDFGTDQNTWIDVDPLDGDPDRNRETSSAPPS